MQRELQCNFSLEVNLIIVRYRESLLAKRIQQTIIAVENEETASELNAIDDRGPSSKTGFVGKNVHCREREWQRRTEEGKRRSLIKFQFSGITGGERVRERSGEGKRRGQYGVPLVNGDREGAFAEAPTPEWREITPKNWNCRRAATGPLISLFPHRPVYTVVHETFHRVKRVRFFESFHGTVPSVLVASQRNTRSLEDENRSMDELGGKRTRDQYDIAR